MSMAVEMIKSRVLIREEKGIGSMTMKRLIFSSMFAGFIFMLARMAVGGWAVPIFIVTLIITLYFTGERHGIPRYYYLVFYWYSRLTLTAFHNPDGWTARIFRLLKKSPDGVMVSGTQVFSGVTVVDDDWSQWEIVADSDHLDDGGLQIVTDAINANDVIIINSEE
jgi:hypothetical protein